MAKMSKVVKLKLKLDENDKNGNVIYAETSINGLLINKYCHN